jgi:hypothetical protein
LSTKKQTDGQVSKLNTKSRQVSSDMLFSGPCLRQEGRIGFKDRKQNLYQVSCF